PYGRQAERVRCRGSDNGHRGRAIPRQGRERTVEEGDGGRCSLCGKRPVCILGHDHLCHGCEYASCRSQAGRPAMTFQTEFKYEPDAGSSYPYTSWEFAISYRAVTERGDVPRDSFII